MDTRWRYLGVNTSLCVINPALASREPLESVYGAEAVAKERARVRGLVRRVALILVLGLLADLHLLYNQPEQVVLPIQRLLHGLHPVDDGKAQVRFRFCNFFLRSARNSSPASRGSPRLKTRARISLSKHEDRGVNITT